MMSDSFTKYWPPPAHMPCTAATTGFQHLCAFGPTRNPGSAWFQMLRWYHHTPSVTSMPVQKARSPSARSTTAWMSSVSRTVRHTSTTSAAIVSLNELRVSGRFSVTVATWSSSTSKMIVE